MNYNAQLRGQQKVGHVVGCLVSKFKKRELKYSVSGIKLFRKCTCSNFLPRDLSIPNSLLWFWDTLRLTLDLCTWMQRAVQALRNSNLQKQCGSCGIFQILLLLMIGGLMYLSFTHSNQSAAMHVKNVRKQFQGRIGTETLSQFWNNRQAPKFKGSGILRNSSIDVSEPNADMYYVWLFQKKTASLAYSVPNRSHLGVVGLLSCFRLTRTVNCGGNANLKFQGLLCTPGRVIGVMHLVMTNCSQSAEQGSMA